MMTLVMELRSRLKLMREMRALETLMSRLESSARESTGILILMLRRRRQVVMEMQRLSCHQLRGKERSMMRMKRKVLSEVMGQRYCEILGLGCIVYK